MTTKSISKVKSITLYLILFATFVIVQSCGNNSGSSSGISNVESLGKVGSKAGEIQGIENWINSKPLNLADLDGKVALIDFWTYSCVNCIRTLPYLKQWHEKYADHGLIIIGVHSPEFNFEASVDNLQSAVDEFGIEWAIAQDNEFETWKAFGNRFWPAKYLIDKQGIIRYTHFGEGEYHDTEMAIRMWLDDAGHDMSNINISNDFGPIQHKLALSRNIEKRQTRELFAGLKFNLRARPPYMVQTEMYENPPDSLIMLEDPGEHLNHFLYFHGMWSNGVEAVKHGRRTNDLEDYVAIKFVATSANVVLGYTTQDYRVYATINESPIEIENRGSDIKEDENGQTYLLIDSSRMYNIMQSSDYLERSLQLKSNAQDFSVFSFSFGSYPEGP
ncbi:MAG: redoxin domain-containing protein [Dehalococcoidia bacterium]|nr:redoxin domain-containing protein [Dehalococcoidia bacterium]